MVTNRVHFYNIDPTLKEANETLDEEYDANSQDIMEQYVTYNKEGLILKTIATTSDGEAEVDIPIDYEEN